MSAIRNPFPLLLAVLFSAGLSLRSQEAAAPRPAKPDAKAIAAARARIRARQKAKKAAEAKAVDINTATKEQLLKKVPGMTEAYAESILAHRPYLTKEHLVVNKAIPEPFFASIRNYVIVRHASLPTPGKPKAK